mmetsp:Transcript_31449/g.61326  ORF Transcript_31449/g.61326 Transcript_31449/m.61326 type:complete len:357 (+) Transcript_31449:622-1692(+)
MRHTIHVQGMSIVLGPAFGKNESDEEDYTANQSCCERCHLISVEGCKPADKTVQLAWKQICGDVSKDATARHHREVSRTLLALVGGFFIIEVCFKGFFGFILSVGVRRAATLDKDEVVAIRFVCFKHFLIFFSTTICTQVFNFLAQRRGCDGGLLCFSCAGSFFGTSLRRCCFFPAAFRGCSFLLGAVLGSGLGCTSFSYFLVAALGCSSLLAAGLGSFSFLCAALGCSSLLFGRPLGGSCPFFGTAFRGYGSFPRRPLSRRVFFVRIIEVELLDHPPARGSLFWASLFLGRFAGSSLLLSARFGCRLFSQLSRRASHTTRCRSHCFIMFFGFGCWWFFWYQGGGYLRLFFFIVVG